MPKKSKKVSENESVYLILVLAVALLLLLALFNLHAYFHPKDKKDVLGAFDESVYEKEFWYDFLKDEPEYLPGWVELVRLEKETGNINGFEKSLIKVFELDPNLKINY